MVGKESGHDAHDDHDGNDQHPFGFCEFGDDPADLIGHPGLKEGLADDEHADAENDVTVYVTRKCL